MTYAITNLAGAGAAVAAAVGRPRFEAEYAIISSSVSIGLALVLGRAYGLYGILAATAIGLTVASVWFLWRFYRSLDLSLRTYFFAWLGRLVGAAAVATMAIRLVLEALPASWTDSRASAAVALAGLTLAYGGLLVLALRVARFFNDRDLQTLRRVLPSPLRRVAYGRLVEFVFHARGTPGEPLGPAESELP